MNANQAPAQAPDDPRVQEWSECRTTIGRLDTILEDLRKYGFSLVTGLLTASAFFGFTTTPVEARAAAFVAIMILVAALFSVDTYYAILLSGAVERALDLEAVLPFRLTKTLSDNALKTKAVMFTVILYISLLVTACAVGGLTSVWGHSWVAAVWVFAIGAMFLVYMVGYWLFASNQTHWHTEKAGRNWQ